MRMHRLPRRYDSMIDANKPSICTGIIRPGPERHDQGGAALRDANDNHVCRLQSIYNFTLYLKPIFNYPND